MSAAIIAAPSIIMTRTRRPRDWQHRLLIKKRSMPRVIGRITTEILPLRNYITAEEYHQNYLKKNPDGYCGLGGTGVKYPDSAGKVAEADTSSTSPEPLRPPSSA